MNINWNDIINPITKEWVIRVRKAEEVFEKQARENPQNLEEIYAEFHHFLFDNYFSNELCNKHFMLAQTRHEWANIVNLPVACLISKFEKKESHNLLEEIIQRVRLTSQLFEAWEEFGNNGGQSLPDLFQQAVSLARATKTHQIVVRGKKLLTEIGFIQTGHKAINFILFLTLLENAQKYSPPGSTITVTISKQLDKIAKKSEGSHYNYYISVSDEGIGIPIEDQEQVLKKGQRGSNVGDIPGNGLGLFMIYGLCNWKVTIISPLYPQAEKNKGTKIKAELYHW